MSGTSDNRVVYRVIGYQYGSFTAEGGKQVDYSSIFAVTPIEGDREGYHGVGDKAHIMKCESASILKDVKVGMDCYLYFNQYKKVSLVMPVK